MKNGLMNRVLSLGCVAAVAMLLSACSGAPNDVIEEAISKSNITLQSGYKIQDYSIVNEYTQDVGNETVYVYEYEGQAEVKDSRAIGMIPATMPLKGTVTLVQRGNSWYTLN